MYYYFILGKNKNLSIAEVLSKKEIIGQKVKKRDVFGEGNTLFVRSSNRVDSLALLRSLGGTIKIGQIFAEFNNLAEIKAQDFLPFLEKKGKVIFGLSGQGVPQSFVKEKGVEIKRELRRQGFSARWVWSKGKELSSVTVKKNKLIEKGAEFYIFQAEGKVYLGKTLAVQDFANYSRRDYSRPRRDVKSGMLPPKLAQIMLNLSGANKEEVLLDPFCGSGTILQEAALMGYKNIIGIDKSRKAIEDTRVNLEWLKENFKFSAKNLKLICHDVLVLSEVIDPNFVDAIVTEPFLGTTSKKFNLQAQLAELSRLYFTAFQEFKKILKRGGKVVIIFPVFIKRETKEEGKNNLKILENFIFLPILSKIQSLGFQTKHFGREFKGLIETTSRGSLLYSRPTPNRRILREIFIWEKDG